MQTLWRTRGAELLDKIGPAIVQTHSAGGPFGFIVTDERPALVKALVCFEGGAGPVLGPEQRGRTRCPTEGHPDHVSHGGELRPHERPAIVAALKAVGRAGGAHQPEGSRHHRQRPLRDGGDQPQGSLRGDPRLDRVEDPATTFTPDGTNLEPVHEVHRFIRCSGNRFTERDPSPSRTRELNLT